MDTLTSFVHRILFLGAVVCLTASANLMLDYNWPSGPDPNINRFPHESSCHYYYLMLSEEDITLEKCPGGQLFDYTKHRCISDKEHIHCWSRHFGKLKHGHLEMKHKKHFKCPYPWGKYPNLHDCSKYHLCLHGKSTVKKCAPFELFDKISRKCIARIDAVCADKSDVIEHGYVCPKAWGSFTYPKDCSKYYECLQKKPSLRMCQKGYLFDDRLAKCAPKEKVYCGVRHNPYGKVSNDAPEISSVPSTIPSEKSTTLNLDVTTIKATEKITSEKSGPQEIKSITQEISSIPKEITSLPHEASSTFQRVSSLLEETSPTLQKITSTQAPSNQPITSEISSPSTGPENINNEIKVSSISDLPQLMNKVEQETSPSTGPETNSNQMKESSISYVPQLMNKVSQETSDPTEDVSEKNEFVEISSTTEKEQVVSSSQFAVNDESEVLKKDVSTEEKDTDDVSNKPVTVEIKEIEGSSHSSSKTVCLQQDPMCITEKDGTVVKCSNSKDLQPHPKDATRFLDCTESSIKIYSCPPNLTFNPRDKKCMWQFIL